MLYTVCYAHEDNIEVGHCTVSDFGNGSSANVRIFLQF